MLTRFPRINGTIVDLECVAALGVRSFDTGRDCAIYADVWLKSGAKIEIALVEFRHHWGKSDPVDYAMGEFAKLEEGLTCYAQATKTTPQC